MWVLLLALVVYAFAAATALSSRLYEERWTRGLTTSLLWFCQLALPIHTLGWLDALSPAAVALLTAAASSAVLFFGARGRPREELRAAIVGACAAPFTIVAQAWRQRHFAAAALVILYAFVAYALFLGWLAPNCNWDGMVYHEPIVGNAIQHQGFAWADAPPSYLWQPLNVFPRIAETFFLFFVYFTDRRLIEVGSALMVPTCVLGFVVVARRHTGELNAICWAIGLVLLPGVLLQYRSTYIDVIVLAEFVSIAAYVSQPRLRLRDVVLASLALGLFSGTKMSAVLIVPLYSLVLLARVLWPAVRPLLPERLHDPQDDRSPRRRWGLVAAAVALPLLFSAAIGGWTYARNYEHYDNPVWPAKLDYPSLGIDLDGPFVPSMQMPAETFLDQLFSPPNEDGQFADTGDNGYGNLAPFVLLPLVGFALPWLCLRVFRRGARDDRILFLTAVPAILALAMSPAIYLARLNLHFVAGVYWVCGRFLGRRGLGQVVAGALVLSAIPTFWWSEPGWGLSLPEVATLLELGPRERVIEGLELQSCMDPATARARETELGPDDTVVYSVTSFTSMMWNERFENEVRWVDPMPCGRYRERLDELGATWAFVVRSSAQGRCLSEHGWEEIGNIGMAAPHNPRSVVALRRTSEH